MQLRSAIPSRFAPLVVAATTLAIIGTAAAGPVIDSEHAGYHQLHSLEAAEGSHPMGVLVESPDNRLYGTAVDAAGWVWARSSSSGRTAR